MANMLRKDKKITFIPGHPAVPASAGQPWIPAHDGVVTTVTCGWHQTVVTDPGTHVGLVPTPVGTTVIYDWGLVDDAGKRTPGQYSSQSVYSCSATTRTVHYPEQQYVAPTSAVTAAASQTIIDLNLGWNAGARSIGVLSAAGRIEFKVPQNVIGAAVGLNDTGSDPGYTNIDFSWYFSGGVARVYENGTAMFYSGAYVTGDVFAIERLNGVIKYKKNGTTVYTSGAYMALPMFMDASLYAGDDSVYDPAIINYGYSATIMQPLRGIGYGTGASHQAGAHVSFQPLTTFSRVAVRSAGSIAPLVSVASDHAYGGSATRLQPLSIFATGGMPMPAYAIANNAMLYITGGGYGTTGEIGGVASNIGPLDGLGSGDDSLITMRSYGSSRARMRPLITYSNAYEGNQNASMLSIYGCVSSLEAPVELVVVMNSSMTVTGVLALQVLKDAAVTSNIATASSASTQALMSELMQSAIFAGFGVPVFDSDSTVWVVNTDNNATSKYENFDFNSFAKIGEKYYGCKADGLYLLEGDTDDGDPIRASIDYGLRNFNTSSLKQIMGAYIGVSSTGTMYLKVTVGDDSYIYEGRRSDFDMATQRIDTGRGLRANYFKFELYNNDGCDFDLSKIEFTSVVLSRRI